MNKLEQAARQLVTNWDSGLTIHDELDALREALAEPDIEKMTLTQIAARHKQAKQEPANVDAINTSSEYVDEIENKRHEPVAWVNKERTQSIEWLKIAPEHGTKLYAAPVRTKDLTDDEIAQVTGYRKSGATWPVVEEVARAVIAADREKNK